MAKQIKLTETEMDLLENGVSGVCIKGEWKWVRKGEPVGRATNKLIKLGLLDPAYYNGGRAGAWATDAGRELLRNKVGA